MHAFPVTYIWLIAGVLLVMIDVLHLGGVGLFFAGLGALAAGAGIWLGLIAERSFFAQWLLFFAATGLWVLILWKPAQRFRLNKQRSHYNNIVGETAYVGSQGLSQKKGGEATWSGTIMKAKLAAGAPDMLEAGTPVIITDVEGATLVVRPKE